MCLVYSKHFINNLYLAIHLLTTVEHILTDSHAQSPNSFYLEAEHKYKSTYFQLRTKANELCWTEPEISYAVSRVGAYIKSQFNASYFLNVCHMSNTVKRTHFSIIPKRCFTSG